jgi:hypothetical protein
VQARLGPSPSANAALGIQGSGFRRAPRTARERLNLASCVAGTDDNYIELFSKCHDLGKSMRQQAKCSSPLFILTIRWLF